MVETLEELEAKVYDFANRTFSSRLAEPRVFYEIVAECDRITYPYFAEHGMNDLRWVARWHAVDRRIDLLLTDGNCDRPVCDYCTICGRAHIRPETEVTNEI
jgi:hypothetical protein